MTDNVSCADNTEREINPRFWGLLSLAMRAGKLAVGEGRAQEKVRGDTASLIILSEDASDNTSKKFMNMGEYHGAAVIRAGDRYRLGNAVGKKFAVVIAVADNGFAENLLKLYRYEKG